MKPNLLITGGVQKRNAIWLDFDKRLKLARVMRINQGKDLIKPFLDYVSPIENVPGGDASIAFGAGTLENEKLYLCTRTEILIYSYPELDLLKVISLPFFNDIHHVKTFEGKLFVANTGLDMVVILDENGQPVRFINVLGKDRSPPPPLP